MSGKDLKRGSIELELYVRDDCSSCNAVEENLQTYCKDRDYLSLSVVDLDDGGTVAPGKQAVITPALWVNGALWSLGSFDLDRFDKRIRDLVRDVARSGDSGLTEKQ